MTSSRRLFERAEELFPGGVNSPVRAAVKPQPFFVEDAHGARITTTDGDELIDWVMGYGPLILGHRNGKVLARVREQLEKGWLYGAPSRTELELAEKILRYYGPGMVRFVNSGTEATLTAIRLARAYTRRRILVKFEGCYHGSNDSLLVKAGSSALHYGVPTSMGVPEELAALTIVLPYNDVEAFRDAMERVGEKVAAVIVEPVAANMGLVLPKEGFLETIKEEAEKAGALLVFDEVVTGFRLGLGGAQGEFGVKPDVTTLGKVIGGGFPIGAVAAGKDLMMELSPSGPAFNAGTFNAHPVSMAAGLATIEALEEGWPYRIADEAAGDVAEELGRIAEDKGLDVTVNRLASMLQIFFTEGPIMDYSDVARSDKGKYGRMQEAMAEAGVFIPPSQFETWFASAAHTEECVMKTVEAARRALVH